MVKNSSTKTINPFPACHIINSVRICIVIQVSLHYLLSSSFISPPSPFILVSDADESLFNQKMKKRSSNEAYITASQYKKIASHCVLLSNDELSNMESMSIIRTQKDRDAAKAKREQEDKIKRARALRRKERILKLAEAAKKKEAKTPLQLEQENEVKDQLKEAHKLLDEQLDEVKMMNRKVQYAVTVAVRDRQIAEKERIKKEVEDEERRLDLLMEIERLKTIQKDEQKKMLDKQKKMRVNEMLMRQKEEARKAKMLDQERKIQEGSSEGGKWEKDVVKNNTLQEALTMASGGNTREISSSSISRPRKFYKSPNRKVGKERHKMPVGAPVSFGHRPSTASRVFDPLSMSIVRPPKKKRNLPPVGVLTAKQLQALLHVDSTSNRNDGRNFGLPSSSSSMAESTHPLPEQASSSQVPFSTENSTILPSPLQDEPSWVLDGEIDGAQEIIKAPEWMGGEFVIGTGKSMFELQDPDIKNPFKGRANSPSSSSYSRVSRRPGDRRGRENGRRSSRSSGGRAMTKESKKNRRWMNVSQSGPSLRTGTGLTDVRIRPKFTRFAAQTHQTTKEKILKYRTLASGNLGGRPEDAHDSAYVSRISRANDDRTYLRASAIHSITPRGPRHDMKDIMREVERRDRAEMEREDERGSDDDDGGRRIGSRRGMGTQGSRDVDDFQIDTRGNSERGGSRGNSFQNISISQRPQAGERLLLSSSASGTIAHHGPARPRTVELLQEYGL